MSLIPLEINPELDLVLERTVPVPVEKVWRAWTEPELLMQWFTPKPWRTVACEIDLRPGGCFNTTMQSPEGQEFPGSGCFLEVTPMKRLVWTDALKPGFRPSGEAFMTGALILEAVEGGTRYTAVARHANAETLKKHEEMGFHNGWSAALDQLVALAETL
ncbi:MAG: SRPBCC family protein [Alphaproteobacteria bacterium]|nr:SRPBCC family protein [Alphaproteobacteria bacterium]MCB9793599.1 SRPBCC family protein [Alphaproteobacteria bacterium]